MGIVRASLKDKVLAAAILIDKARLIEGEGYLKRKEEKEDAMPPKEAMPEARKENITPEARREDIIQPRQETLEQDVNIAPEPENLK